MDVSGIDMLECPVCSDDIHLEEEVVKNQTSKNTHKKQNPTKLILKIYLT